MILIKLGGSIISDKNKPFSFNEDVVRNVAAELKKFYPEKDFILVHGGGSFGHPMARKYGIREGAKAGETKKLIGFSHTHEAMLELNEKIIDIFLKAELPAFSISSSSIFITNNGNIVHGELKVIKEALKIGLIPVLFGDVVIDESKGMDIISGDAIMAYIANEMMAERAIFLMDVDGIYDKEPGKEDARLIDVIDETTVVKHGMEKIDVTGGIKNKIQEAMKMDCMVYFINGLVKGNLTKAIKGEKVGTIKKRK